MLTPNIFINFNESDPLIQYSLVIKIELKLPLQYSHINILILAD